MTIPRLDNLDKNFIINGGMDYFQRALSVSNITLTQYVADRFLLYTYAGGVGVISRLEDAPSSIPGLKYCANYAMTTTIEDGSSQSHRVTHRIESIFSKELVGQKISFSCWVKTADFTHIGFRVYTPDTEDDFSLITQEFLFETPITNDDTWKKVVFENFTVPASGVRGLQFALFAKNATGGGVTNFKITGFKINKGIVAQDFSYAGRNIIEELQLCQRYFEVGHLAKNGQAVNSGRYMDGQLNYHAIKRIPPVILKTNMNQQGYPSPGVSSNVQYIYAAALANSTVTHAYWNFDWTADCEL